MPSIPNARGERIYFEERGAEHPGLPVVLGHSFLCSMEMWAAQIEVLSMTRRVIALDYRGHGRSDPVSAPYALHDLVDDTVAVLDHLGVAGAVWGGLSIGGMVSMRAALSVPDRVAALILVNTHAGAELLGKRLKYRALALVVRAAGVRPIAPALLPIMFGPTARREQPDLVAAWRERFAAAHVPSMLAGLGALLGRRSVEPALSRIGCPTLVVVGAEDRAIGPDLTRAIARAIAGSQRVEIPACGHLAAVERPEAVTRAMEAFLATLESP